MRGFLPRLLICSSLALVAAGCQADMSEPEPDPRQRLPGGETTNQLLLGSQAFLRPASNLTPEHETDFYTGNSFFNQGWVEAPASTTGRDGLGPLFNARSCSGCHFKDGRGRPSLSEDEAHQGFLVRLSVPGPGQHGEPTPDPRYGGQLQDNALPGVFAEGLAHAEWTPRQGHYEDGEPYELLEPSWSLKQTAYGEPHPELEISPRTAPVMVGLGLLEAITEQRMEELSDPEDKNGDGISGRINQVWDVEAQALRPGRFGWKAEQPSLRQQNAAAFLGDMGITSPLFQQENCTQAQPECMDSLTGGEPELSERLLHKVTVYTATIAVPVRRDWDAAEVLRGQALFQAAGCDGCHTPSHLTGDYPGLPELGKQLIWPYTDLLLHDMGPELADGRPVFGADGQEWRTPPLWGVGLIPEVNGHQRLMHDGRARGVAEAILWHGGEAQGAQEAFLAMPKDDREALVRFVNSL
jgi:CxxC motif-containing protein (DUF1111 family)